MENAMSIAAVLGPFYLIMGLSMLIHKKPWQKMIKVYKEDYFSLVLFALIEITIGIAIINAYNVWEWNVWLLVTLTGWIMLLEGGVYLFLPKSCADGWMGPMHKNGALYPILTIIFIAVGVTLSYSAYLQLI